MKHESCGGEVLYRREEGVFYCGRCGKIFPTIEDLNTDNQISNDIYESEYFGGDEE